MAYAQNSIQDLEDRSASFSTAMERYLKVLVIRKQAVAAGEDVGAGGGLDGTAMDNDDTGSLFSAASTTASHATLKSTASTSSRSSAVSMSSVISVKTNTTFSLSGADNSARHRSKWNERGPNQAQSKKHGDDDNNNNNNRNQKKKKKKKNKGRTKVIPGSQQELLGLVETLQSLCPDEYYCQTLQETMTFLIHNGQLPLAKMVLDTYQSPLQLFSPSHDQCLEQAQQERIL